MARMRNPPHPGDTLREDVLPALGLTVTAAADALDVSRVTFSKVINGKAGISPEMALRLERWLGADHGGRAEVWLRMQAAHDLAAVEKVAKPILRKVKPVAYDEPIGA